MASSGWQTEKFATNSCFSSYVCWKVNLNVNSITHTGTNLTISGRVAWCTRQREGTSGGGSTTFGSSYPCSLTPQGGSTYTVVNGGVKQSVGSDYYGPSSSTWFTVTIPNVPATATSYTYSCSWAAPGNNTGAYGGTTSGSVSWTLSFDASGTAPAAPTVTLDSFTDTSATLSMAVSDYGTPAAASGRKLRGAVLGLNSWTDPCRYQDVTDVSSATVTLSNASGTGTTPLTLAGNTQYYYGAEANNTVMSTHTIASNAFITLPAYITNVTVADDGHNDMTISVLHDSEGSADTVYTEYSYDQQTWTAVPETFHLTVYSATTVYLRRENGAGITPVYTVSIVPVTTIKLYGSVNNQAKTIRKLYGSVNGQSKRIRKLYGSVNGRSKLIFEDNS